MKYTKQMVVMIFTSVLTSGFIGSTAFAASKSDDEHEKMMRDQHGDNRTMSGGMGMRGSRMDMMGSGSRGMGMMNMMQGGGGMMGSGNRGMTGMMQGGGGMMGGGMSMMDSSCPMGMMGMGHMKMMRMLNLDDSQNKKMRALRKTMRKQHLAMIGPVLDAREDYAELMSRESPEPSAVGKAFARWATAKQNLIEAVVKSRNDMRAILNSKQREQLNNMMQGDGMMQSGGMMGGMGRKGMMGGMMQ